VLGATPSTAGLLSIIDFARAVVIPAVMLVPGNAVTGLAFGAAIGLLWLATVPLTSGIIVGQFGTQHAGGSPADVLAAGSRHLWRRSPR
jgi:hypothetical protein